MKLTCPRCFSAAIDKGRAFDGRRAYRCANGHEWTNGHKGKRRYSEQRPGNQFSDTGAAKK